jgi:hypothetical protein
VLGRQSQQCGSNRRRQRRRRGGQLLRQHGQRTALLLHDIYQLLRMATRNDVIQAISIQQ